MITIHHLGRLFKILAISYLFILCSCDSRSNESKSASQGANGKNAVTTNEPQFLKEGKLWFLDETTLDTLAQIEIEIADDNNQRAQGLMNRSKMEEKQGMLFIFNNEANRTFWMKNTLISLDILYVDSEFKIITIHKHTQPYSENPIESFKPAMYVVETVAGFTDRHHIDEGDQIYYTSE